MVGRVRNYCYTLIGHFHPFSRGFACARFCRSCLCLYSRWQLNWVALSDGETSSQAWTTRWLAHNLWDKQVRRESPKACVGWISQMLALPGCKVQCLATCFPNFPNNKNQKVYQPAIRNLLSMCRARVAFFLSRFVLSFAHLSHQLQTRMWTTELPSLLLGRDPRLWMVMDGSGEVPRLWPQVMSTEETQNIAK